MGIAKIPKPVKLIIGFIFKEEKLFYKYKRILERKFGKTDFESQTLPFRHTDYYEKEFGRELKRKFVSFKKLIPASALPKIKVFTNAIEKKSAKNGSRIINIDPGCLSMAKVILASTKDYRHRIYLDLGIYAEVTLFYQDKGFRHWEWTYPDYKDTEYLNIFNRIREIYAQQTK